MTLTPKLVPALVGGSTYLLLSADASATAMIEYTPGPTAVEARVDGPWTIGTLIRVGASGILVTHLGIQDADAPNVAQDPDGDDGLTGFADDDGFFRDTFGGGAPLQVGLWTADGATLLASAAVGSTDPVTGSYRYVTLAIPVALTADTNYLIGATVGGGIEWFLEAFSNPTIFSAGAGITMLESRFVSGATLAAPTNNGAPLGRWAPANAMFNIVPEPSAALVCMAGSLGLMLRRRRTC